MPSSRDWRHRPVPWSSCWAMGPTGFGAMPTSTWGGWNTKSSSSKSWISFMPANTFGAIVVAILTPRSPPRPGQPPLNDRLETDGPGPILAAMAAPEAQHPGAGPEKVAEHHRYFVKQADRMDYPRYKALGLPIGSGIVEGACKTLRDVVEPGRYPKHRHVASALPIGPGAMADLLGREALCRGTRSRARRSQRPTEASDVA